ncbi:hypothetical protein U728_533 [Clostridium botulinum 202F]|nr:hypothetical protein U728_533 [Clostridium botulinum 202F]
MDDHTLDRISDDINLCFMEAEYKRSNKFNK